jgi:Uma2 family endonuclease
LTPMSPPPGFRHGKVAMNLGFVVTAFVRASALGWTTGAETGFRLRRNPDTVRGPDFAFVARGRITPEMDQSRYLDLALDLVVEVVSPSDSAPAINAKVIEYLDAGVRLVWVVYPQSETVAVHRPGLSSQIKRAGDTISGEDVLPGFSCAVGELFADPTFAEAGEGPISTDD